MWQMLFKLALDTWSYILASTCKSCPSQWPRGLRRRSAVARLLSSWVWIPRGAWMFVCCKLSGRGLCDELITRPEESYRLWCVVVCDLETSRIWEGHDPCRFAAPQQKKNIRAGYILLRAVKSVLGSETPGNFTEYLWNVQLSKKTKFREGKGLLIDLWV
jgi:hypothetical protein